MPAGPELGHSPQPWCSAMNRSKAARWRLVFRDRRGVAATEFALTLPVMAVLLAGMVEVATTVQTMMNDKAAAYTVADLVSRCRTVNTADITDDFTAAALIITSTKTLPSTVSAFVASVSFNSTTGSPSIDWSKGVGTSLPTNAAVIGDATGKGTAGNSVIVSVINYSYTPFGQTIPPVIISNVAYASPRLVQKIPNTAACDWSM